LQRPRRSRRSECLSGIGGRRLRDRPASRAHRITRVIIGLLGSHRAYGQRCWARGSPRRHDRHHREGRKRESAVEGICACAACASDGVQTPAPSRQRACRSIAANRCSSVRGSVVSPERRRSLG
jgi:hypothetical protein